MPWSIRDASTDYDDTQPWSSMFVPGPYRPSADEEQRWQQAVSIADPATPNAVIRDCMTHAPVLDWGPPRPEPTIESVISGEAMEPPHLYDRSPSDFSGTPGGYEGSSRNNISVGF